MLNYTERFNSYKQADTKFQGVLGEFGLLIFRSNINASSTQQAISRDAEADRLREHMRMNIPLWM